MMEEVRDMLRQADALVMDDPTSSSAIVIEAIGVLVSVLEHWNDTMSDPLLDPNDFDYEAMT
jgi:hypothetical protein